MRVGGEGVVARSGVMSVCPHGLRRLAGWLLCDGDPGHLEFRREGGRRGEGRGATRVDSP